MQTTQKSNNNKSNYEASIHITLHAHDQAIRKLDKGKMLIIIQR